MTARYRRDSLNFPNVILNDQEKTVLVNGEDVHIQPVPFKILKEIMDADGDVVDRLQLLERIWGDSVYESEFSTKTVDVHVCRLRNQYKIGERIQTKSKFGYRWVK